jgi:ribonuclease R
MVHRLLKEYDTALPSPKRKKDLQNHLKDVCEISSKRERQALEAERESIRIKQVEWLLRHQDEEFEGIISGVLAFGIFVETLPYLIEGLVRIERLADDFYIFDEKTYSLIGKDSGRVLRLGDTVQVKVDKIDREHNEIDFLLIEDGEL